MAYLNDAQLKNLRLGSVGENVSISDKVTIYSPENLHIGSNVRIDDFCVISAKGGVTIGNYVHISIFSAIFGGAGVEICDYSGLSARCTIYSESDDFSGESLIHPFYPEKFKPGYKRGKVILKPYTQLGAVSTVLPGCIMEEGAVVGAHSLVSDSLREWTVNAGVPAIYIKERSRNVLTLMSQFQRESETEGNQP